MIDNGYTDYINNVHVDVEFESSEGIVRDFNQAPKVRGHYVKEQVKLAKASKCNRRPDLMREIEYRQELRLNTNEAWDCPPWSLYYVS